MKKGLLIIPITLIFWGCGGSKSNNPPPDITPLKADLSSPARDAVCITGSIVSETQSSVVFNWLEAKNTDSYDLTLKNLLTNAVTKQSTNQTHLTITLLLNTPYSWSVLSRSTKTNITAVSETWKFYNSGPGAVSYAPFPAEITFPAFGQLVTATSGNINLTWKGSSVTPGTIANYDIYFGDSNVPPIFQSAITNSFINNISVVSNTTYYWKITTRDIQGNTSSSGLYQFTVN